MNFEQALKNEVERIRDSISETNAISLSFNISVTGRVNDGDLKIAFSLGETYSKGGQVEGGILENVLREYKRRYGWAEVNQPLCLPCVAEPVPPPQVGSADDSIPF